MALASRLRLAREQAGLSQGQVAKLMDMHRPTISEIEAGRRRVSGEELAEFASHYDVSTSWLVGEGKENDSRLDRINLAARELAKLRDEDVDKLLNLLRTFRQPGEQDE
jgi:transcriptional regulator with XRE-family HTH domain